MVSISVVTMGSPEEMRKYKLDLRTDSVVSISVVIMGSPEEKPKYKLELALSRFCANWLFTSSLQFFFSLKREKGPFRVATHIQ